MAHWPLRQSNSTKNTSFQKSSPESSPVQNPGPVQGIVLPRQMLPGNREDAQKILRVRKNVAINHFRYRGRDGN